MVSGLPPVFSQLVMPRELRRRSVVPQARARRAVRDGVLNRVRACVSLAMCFAASAERSTRCNELVNPGAALASSVGIAVVKRAAAAIMHRAGCAPHDLCVDAGHAQAGERPATEERDGEKRQSGPERVDERDEHRVGRDPALGRERRHGGEDRPGARCPHEARGRRPGRGRRRRPRAAASAGLRSRRAGRTGVPRARRSAAGAAAIPTAARIAIATLRSASAGSPSASRRREASSVKTVKDATRPDGQGHGPRAAAAHGADRDDGQHGEHARREEGRDPCDERDREQCGHPGSMRRGPPEATGGRRVHRTFIGAFRRADGRVPSPRPRARRSRASAAAPGRRRPRPRVLRCARRS